MVTMCRLILCVHPDKQSSGSCLKIYLKLGVYVSVHPQLKMARRWPRQTQDKRHFWNAYDVVLVPNASGLKGLQAAYLNATRQ